MFCKPLSPCCKAFGAELIRLRYVFPS
jgi:hypothetical protein